jgi:large subunit ribosomal protein L18
VASAHQGLTGRLRRHRRVRKRVYGTPERPRLCVFRSLRYVYAQIIDDEAGRTLVAADSREPELMPDAASRRNVDAARAVGKALGERAKAAGIEKVVFDRGGYLYHGRVRALAEAAREAGLEF